MQDFWPASGLPYLNRNLRGWLEPTKPYLRLFLTLPELALVSESCAAEVALHEALVAEPARRVEPGELAALQDADVRANYAMFLAFRDALIRAGTLEAYYLELIRSGSITIPPVFIDRIVCAVVHNLLRDSNDVFQVRAAEMLFRPQRITVNDGQILAGDAQVLDLLNDTAGFGDIGRLLVQSQAPLHTVTMDVLTQANAGNYWTDSARHRFLLDLTHEVGNDLGHGHGLSLVMTRAQSGLKALARVLERWVSHFLGVSVSITVLSKIDDAAWRWHLGLDTESSALLNDLYEDRPVDAVRMKRLISLFRLDFTNPQEMRADVTGKPVYLGLAMTSNNAMRLKPQNLLLNLPLASAM